MEKLIFLIGFRAVGKTTVGRELAARLAHTFLDTDEIICRKKGCSIEAIVNDVGWEGFRHLEREVLAELCRCRNCVVSTGGGAILHREIWQTLRQISLVVWLTASPDVLISRLRQDEGSAENRPSLTGRDAASELRDVLARREPQYRETAHLAIATEMLQVMQIVDIIEQVYVQERGREKE